MRLDRSCEGREGEVALALKHHVLMTLTRDTRPRFQWCPLTQLKDPRSPKTYTFARKV